MPDGIAFEESVKTLRLDHRFIAYHKPEDDLYVESFHGRFKREYLWTRDFQTFQEAEQDGRGLRGLQPGQTSLGSWILES